MFSLMLPFFESKGAEYTAATLIAAGGTVLTLLAQRQIAGVKATKNTVGFSEKFMKWYLPTCVLLALTSIFGLTSTFMAGHAIYKGKIPWLVIDSFFILMNGYLFYANYYTYKVKQENVKAAKLAKMSEGEHYEKVIAPSLLKVSKAKK